MRRFSILAGALLVLLAMPCGAQSPSQPAKDSPSPAAQPSLAELARLNREKKQAAAKSTTPNKTNSAVGPKREVSNDDVERPSERRGVSLYQLLEEAEEAERAAALARRRRATERQQEEDEESVEPARRSADRPRHLPQGQDPEYYRVRLQPLREELARVDSELSRLRSNARYDYRTGSYVSAQDRYSRTPTISNTLKNDIERHESKRRDLLKRIAEIQEEAARNGLSVY